MGGLGNPQHDTRGSITDATYNTKEDQEGVPQEEDVGVRYYFSRYGRLNLDLIRYGESSAHRTLNQELAWGRSCNIPKIHPNKLLAKNYFKIFSTLSSNHFLSEILIHRNLSR